MPSRLRLFAEKTSNTRLAAWARNPTQTAIPGRPSAERPAWARTALLAQGARRLRTKRRDLQRDSQEAHGLRDRRRGRVRSAKSIEHHESVNDALVAHRRHRNARRSE